MFAPLPPAKMHSVRHLNKPTSDVQTHMYQRHSVQQDLSNPDSVQKINNDLLQIISGGINGIVMQLKNRLGNNYEESNQNAIDIKHMLNTLQTQIQTDIDFIGLPANPNTPFFVRIFCYSFTYLLKLPISS